MQKVKAVMPRKQPKKTISEIKVVEEILDDNHYWEPICKHVLKVLTEKKEG